MFDDQNSNSNRTTLGGEWQGPKEQKKMNTEHDVEAEIEQVVATLSTATEKIRELGAEVEELAMKLRIARGTVDMQPPEDVQIVEAPAQLPMPFARLPRVAHDVRAKIENALTRESLTANQLAKTVGESVGKVSGSLRQLRASGQIYNVGSADHPMWVWRIGDSTSTQVLVNTVRRLIMERPMTTRELVDATGARPARVSGALVALQRGQEKIRDLGTHGVSRWFIVAEGRDAKLAPKRQV